MTLSVIGLNHRTAPVELRERCFLGVKNLQPLMVDLQAYDEISECAVLSTCNRLEIYMETTDDAGAQERLTDHLCAAFDMERAELAPHLYALWHQQAIDHLMRVAAGLDSMILGESQILGQVNNAYQHAHEAGTAQSHLNRLFEHAIHAGKRAHAETAIGHQTISVSHAAVLLAREQLEMVDDAQVLIIGAGDMARIASQAARDEGIEVALINRTYKHAQDLAGHVGCRVFDWSELWDKLTTNDVVIAATGAPHYVFYRHSLERVMEQRDGRPLTFIDVAVPRDVEPSVAEIPNITIYDIDDLQRVVDSGLRQREAAIPAVKSIVQEEREKYLRWLSERDAVPTLTQLRHKIESIANAELQDALQRLRHLDVHDQELVARLTHRIVNKILHEPTVGLRENAADGEVEPYATVLHELFGLNGHDNDYHEEQSQEAAEDKAETVNG